MSKKIMIITYNDTGGCFVKNYHEGDISVKQKERAVTDKDGNVVATIPTHQNIKMKKMKECEMTSDDLINVIDHLKTLKDRCVAKEISDIVKRDRK
jgi:hypothetical protein